MCCSRYKVIHKECALSLVHLCFKSLNNNPGDVIRVTFSGFRKVFSLAEHSSLRCAEFASYMSVCKYLLKVLRCSVFVQVQVRNVKYSTRVIKHITTIIPQSQYLLC